LKESKVANIEKTIQNRAEKSQRFVKSFKMLFKLTIRETKMSKLGQKFKNLQKNGPKHCPEYASGVVKSCKN
jgi:hypothetical protein